MTYSSDYTKVKKKTEFRKKIKNGKKIKLDPDSRLIPKCIDYLKEQEELKK